jgi:hypothetical protein
MIHSSRYIIASPEEKHPVFIDKVLAHFKDSWHLAG